MAAPVAASVVAALCLSLSLEAAAQGARRVAPAGSASAPAKGASAAMERVQRAADSPLRAILEAAKVRRRIEPEPTGADAEAALRRATALRQVQATLPEAAPVAPPAVSAAVWLPPQVAVPPATSTVILTLPEAATPVAPARAAGLDAAAVAPLRAASAAAALPGDAARAPLPELPATAATPQLVHLVQPDVPQRLLDQLARAEVTVEFVIGSDGRVSSIAVLPPVPRPLVPLITAAVEQWRYAPLPAARPHRVQLVFKEGP